MKGKRQTSLRHIGYLLMEGFAIVFIVMTLVIAFLFFSVIAKTGTNVVQMFLMSVVIVSVPVFGACHFMMVDARRREWMATGAVARDGPPWRKWKRRGLIAWVWCVAGMGLTAASFWRQLIANLP